MLKVLNYNVSKEILAVALSEIITNDFRITLNRPTGDFFYDPWILQDQYKDTVWEHILNALPFEIGEARIITLKSGTCYTSHADIDDRYHLNILGDYSYLIDLDSNTMYPTVLDGVWYEMNTGLRHVAANFGCFDRIQLVVRKLLIKKILKKPISISITFDETLDKARFQFDDKISPWLNYANKDGIISNFSTDLKTVWLDIENESLSELSKIIPIGFSIKFLS